MPKPVIIAVDAMGGDNSPNKTICGIKEYLTKKKDVYFRIFGRRKSIENELLKHSINKNLFEIINCDDVVENNDTPLAAAKKKNTSMWQSINDVKNKKYIDLGYRNKKIDTILNELKDKLSLLLGSEEDNTEESVSLTNEIQTKMQEIGQEIYSQPQPESNSNDDSNDDSDTIEGEYKEV